MIQNQRPARSPNKQAVVTFTAIVAAVTGLITGIIGLIGTTSNQVVPSETISTPIRPAPTPVTTIAPSTAPTDTPASATTTGTSLSALQPIDVKGNVLFGPAQVNGVHYSSSLIFDSTGLSGTGRDIEMSFDLGRNYSSLRFIAGLTDESSAAGTGRLAVIVDGRIAFEQELGIGETFQAIVDVSGALRLTLVATDLDPRKIVNVAVSAAEVN